MLIDTYHLNIPKLTITAKLETPEIYVPRILKTASDSAELLRSLYNPDEMCLLENFYVLAMNQRSEVIGVMHLSRGGATCTIVDVKLLMVALLGCGAQSFIVSHNHPSGNLQPSSQDMAITKKMKEAGKLLDIELLDHVIMTHNGYRSFAEEGLL